MTIDKDIPIKNIFYMLTYAFKELNREHYKRVEGSPVKVCGLGIDLHQSEEKELTVNNTSELCSEMLDLCIEGFC